MSVLMGGPVGTRIINFYRCVKMAQTYDVQVGDRLCKELRTVEKERVYRGAGILLASLLTDYPKN